MTDLELRNHALEQAVLDAQTKNATLHLQLADSARVIQDKNGHLDATNALLLKSCTLMAAMAVNHPPM